MGDLLKFPRKHVCRMDCQYKGGWIRLMKFIRVEIELMTSQEELDDANDERLFVGRLVSIPLLVFEGVHLFCHFV